MPVYDLTGQGLATVITDSLTKCGVHMQFLRGQGYDGAAAMSGRLHGAQAYVRSQHPMALYVHCSSYSLNLAVSDACSVVPIRNCLGTIGSMYNFLNTPKRQHVLRDSIGRVCPSAHSTRLIQMCPTRWVERHDCVILFIELLKAIIDCLEVICHWPDKDSSSGANHLLHSICQPEFLVALHVSAKVFAVNIGLCRSLQQENIDLVEAMNLADNVRVIVEDMRSNAESVFAEVFANVAQLCNDIGVDLVKPRLCKRQTNRCNITADTPETYYRLAVFLPFTDSFCMQLQERLLEHRTVLQDFMCLVPRNCPEKPNCDQVAALKRLVETYAVDVGCSKDIAVAEQLMLWYKQLSSVSEHPRNAIEAYTLCSEITLPCIKKLLQIMVTLPVTTCTSERSFSTLRRVKTYLRSTMGCQRLNGLALLNIHRDIPISTEAAIDRLAQKPRRLPFRLK